MPCKITNEDTLRLPYLIFIRYYHARLVMNRHLYGSTHGVSINKLLVSSTMLMSHPRGDAASFRRSIDERPRPVCAHIGMRKPHSPSLAPAQLPKLKASPSSDFRRCEGTFGSCPFCLTDYHTDISWQGAKKGNLIKLVIYRQLGECRSPFEWSWTSRLALRTDKMHRIEVSTDYRPGFVRDRWSKAESVTCSSKGEWVNVPEMKVSVPASSQRVVSGFYFHAHFMYFMLARKGALRRLLHD
jgi:hypothetical protein